MPVLRLPDGSRVFDAGDVEALLAFAQIYALIERKWVGRIAAGDLPSTAQTRHVEECGHRLSFGCCNGRAPGHNGDSDPRERAVA
jgi:hypothetical protein